MIDFFSHGVTTPTETGPPHYRRFMITLRHTALGTTPLVQCVGSRRDLYLTKHNTHKRQTTMPPAEFEPAIAARERPQAHALDSAATGFGTQ
jgi:hypothetical protein